MRIVEQIMGRVHVGKSDRQAIRQFMESLKDGYSTWKSLDRDTRRMYLEAIITEHRKNQKTYAKRFGSYGTMHPDHHADM